MVNIRVRFLEPVVFIQCCWIRVFLYLVRKADESEAGKSLAVIMNNKYEPAFIVEWILGIAGLLFLVIAYALFMPVANILIGNFVEAGAPLAPMMWIRFCLIIAFLIFGILCLVYPFLSSYRKTYDQGIQQPPGW